MPRPQTNVDPLFICVCASGAKATRRRLLFGGLTTGTATAPSLDIIGPDKDSCFCQHEDEPVPYTV